MLIQHFLEKSAADFSDNIALIHGRNRVSYGQIYQDAVAIAQTLKKEGLLAGERVAVFSDIQIINNLTECPVFHSRIRNHLCHYSHKLRKINR